MIVWSEAAAPNLVANFRFTDLERLELVGLFCFVSLCKSRFHVSMNVRMEEMIFDSTTSLNLL